MCRIPWRDARLAPAPPRNSPLHPRAGLLPPWRAERAGVVAPSDGGCGPSRQLQSGAAGPAVRVWYPSGSPRSRRSSLSDDRRGGPRSPGVPTPSGPVAQLAEQQTLNLLVEGSTPSRLTNFSLRSSWSRREFVSPTAPVLRTSPFGSTPRAAHHFIFFDIKRFHGFVRSVFGLRMGPMWESCGNRSRLREFVQAPRTRSAAASSRGTSDPALAVGEQMRVYLTCFSELADDRDQWDKYGRKAPGIASASTYSTRPSRR